MTHDELSRRLLLTTEICQQLQFYVQEITRENPSRAFLESFASRALKRAAELYALSRPEAFATTEAQPVSAERAEAEIVCRTRDPRVAEIIDLWDGRRE
jgi:hypothetical protein